MKKLTGIIFTISLVAFFAAQSFAQNAIASENNKAVQKTITTEKYISDTGKDKVSGSQDCCDPGAEVVVVRSMEECKSKVGADCMSQCRSGQNCCVGQSNCCSDASRTDAGNSNKKVYSYHSQKPSDPGKK